MKLEKLFFSIGLFSLLFVFTQCENDDFTQDDVSIQASELSAKGGKPTGGEIAGNNLSFPVIWSDGVTKALPGTKGQYALAGEWWGVWGVDPIDPQADLYSCGPFLAFDDIPCPEADYRAYVQKDSRNVWQASNWIPTVPINVDLVDWGDNLESVDWYTTSQVRVEMVLLENTETSPDQVIQFAMRHVSGWGTDEVHGLQTETDSTDVAVYGTGTQATVYSDNARFTIQKLNVDKTDGNLNLLQWDPVSGWYEPGENPLGLINDPVLNMKAVAEINVKGKIIYGYTWKVKSYNDGEGYYRITFSFDPNANLKTYFDQFSQFVELPPEVAILAEDGEVGGIPILDFEKNLTYIDILIKRKTGGGR